MKLNFKDIPNKKLLIASILATITTAGAVIAAPPHASQVNQGNAKQEVTAQKQVDRIETKTTTETVTLPFDASTENDPTLESGVSKISTIGENGEKTITYETTYTNGQETDHRKVKEEITKQPVNQITSLGTKSRSSCDSNYSGACVPIASDVDCAGGSGNGPAYVSGPVYVTGYDKYGLDRDGDGTGCNN